MFPSFPSVTPSHPAASSAQSALQIRRQRPQLAPLTIPSPSPYRFQRVYSQPMASTRLRSLSVAVLPSNRQTAPLSVPTVWANRLAEQIVKQALRRDMTPPEQQVINESALLDWADMASRAAAIKIRSASNPSRPEKDACPCRSFPSQVPYTPQTLGSPPLRISHRTLLAQFEPLRQILGAYSGKISKAKNDEIDRTMKDIGIVIHRLARCTPESMHAWTREDMQTGIRATLLINRLHKAQLSSSAQGRQRQERPAWKR